MLTTSLHSTRVCIHAAISFSGNISAGKCIASDAKLLDALLVLRTIAVLVICCWLPGRPPRPL